MHSALSGLLGRLPGALGVPSTAGSLPQSGSPGVSAQPPFIVSNALAAASGLGSPRRTLATTIPTRSPTAPQVRLPAHKDLLDDDRELAAVRAQTRARFEHRLADDHAHCLAPDTSAFTDAADVAKRLLPYHVWNVPDDDLLRAADARIETREQWASRDTIDNECSYTTSYKRRRTDTPAVISLPPFPTGEYATDVHQRHQRMLRDIDTLRRKADGVGCVAPLATLSDEQLERLAYEEESRAYQAELAELRRLRAELEDIDRRISWGARAAAPRMAPLSPAVVSHLAGLTARAPGAATAAQPVLAQLSQSAPSQPLPLVVPISAVSRMTAFGINIVPAPHLVPALSLASAGQSVPISPGLTAPRPLATPQTDPVLLVGITEGQVPGVPGATRQQLHLSVVLSMMRGDQLSGLATLMQALQAEDGARARGEAT